MARLKLGSDIKFEAQIPKDMVIGASTQITRQKLLVDQAKTDVMLKIQDLQVQNRKQNRLNVILAIAIILNIVFHLF